MVGGSGQLWGEHGTGGAEKLREQKLLQDLRSLRAPYWSQQPSIVCWGA